MKYIIRESMVSNVFKNYMNSQYDLKYNHNTREFINVNKGKFYHYDYSQELFLEGLFGPNMNKLLLDYLNERFPEVDIRSVEQ
jgi:hypothetical protein